MQLCVTWTITQLRTSETNEQNFSHEIIILLLSLNFPSLLPPWTLGITLKTFKRHSQRPTIPCLRRLGGQFYTGAVAIVLAPPDRWRSDGPQQATPALPPSQEVKLQSSVSLLAHHTSPTPVPVAAPFIFTLCVCVCVDKCECICAIAHLLPPQPFSLCEYQCA